MRQYVTCSIVKQDIISPEKYICVLSYWWRSLKAFLHLFFPLSLSSTLSLSLSLSLPSSVAPFFLPTFQSLVSMCPLQSSLPNTQHQAHFTCINTTDVYRIHISLSPNFVWICHKPSKYAVWQRHSGNHCHVSSCIIFFALLDLNRTRY